MHVICSQDNSNNATMWQDVQKFSNINIKIDKRKLIHDKIYL